MKRQLGLAQSIGVGMTAIWLAMSATIVAAQDTPAPAPKMAGGANSISETYDDWVLNCQAAANGTECALLQVLSQQNGQRVLTFSISPTPVNGNYMGSFIMPFGLELAAGVTIGLDDKAPSNPLAYKTCLPAGCLVPLSWTTEQFNAMRAANNIKLAAQAATGEPFALTVSLKGLLAAGKRAEELVRN